MTTRIGDERTKLVIDLAEIGASTRWTSVAVPTGNADQDPRTAEPAASGHPRPEAGDQSLHLSNLSARIRSEVEEAVMLGQGMSVGLDVHARSVVACGLDGQTGQLFERRLTPDHGEVLEWVRSLQGPTVVTYEAGPTGHGLAVSFDAAGIRCLVAAPSKLQLKQAVARGLVLLAA